MRGDGGGFGKWSMWRVRRKLDRIRREMSVKLHHGQMPKENLDYYLKIIKKYDMDDQDARNRLILNPIDEFRRVMKRKDT